MSEQYKNDWIREIDERSRLAGTNRLEILLFSLGEDSSRGITETYGLNVFKVREVMRTPPITAAPEMPPSVKGLVSLRGALVPVIDLAEYCGIESSRPREILIVTEYNVHQQGFLVDSVERIVRMDWGRMKLPPEMISSSAGGLVTAVTELDDGRLAMVIDVEKILADVSGSDESLFKGLPEFSSTASFGNDWTILFADDSPVARGQIVKTLDAVSLPHFGVKNGKQALDYLMKLADSCSASGIDIAKKVPLLLSDVEMPEMDGYTLVKTLRADPRFKNMKVLMHSSLSNENTMKLSSSVGADMHVSKLDPPSLVKAISSLLNLRAT